MLENIENIENTSFSNKDLYRRVELEYINECVRPPRVDDLIERIDNIQGCLPPKALDSDPFIAEIIEPIKDQIPAEYLEAPSDMEQVNQISDVMLETKGLKLDEWKEFTIEQRTEVLNELECRIAQIEHRPACPIIVKYLGPVSESNGKLQGHLGTHVTTCLGEEYININSELLKSDNPICHRKVLDTVIHEGRHSYQTYNLEQRETHTSQGDLTNWQINLEKYGYQDAQMCGFKAYWMQPIEADARKFAEDVLTAYNNKL